MKPLFMLKWSVLLAAVVLGGCNLPSRPATVTEAPEAAYTAAAETIVAQLTHVTPLETVLPQDAPAGDAATQTPAPTATATPLPSATPTQTSTPEPSATLAPSATATTPAGDPRTALGDPDWRDTFKNSNNWSVYDDSHVGFTIDDGKLNMNAFFAEGRDSWMLTWPEPQDFYLEATFRTHDCSGLDRYGLIVRSDASTGYLVGLSCDGQVSVRRWNGDKFKALLDWTAAPGARTGAGQDNRLGVMVNGSEISVYVNGVLAGEASDDQYEEGSFGVFVGSKNTDDLQVDVTEIAYWEISN